MSSFDSHTKKIQKQFNRQAKEIRPNQSGKGFASDGESGWTNENQRV